MMKKSKTNYAKWNLAAFTVGVGSNLALGSLTRDRTFSSNWILRFGILTRGTLFGVPLAWSIYKT